MTVGRVRGDSYRIARALGDVQAAKQGPVALGKRVVRKQAYRKTNGVLWEILKALGLG